MDQFIFTRIGCRILDLAGAEEAKAALCALSGEFKYFAGIGTWLLVLTVDSKLIGYFFAPSSAPENDKHE